MQCFRKLKIATETQNFHDQIVFKTQSNSLILHSNSNLETREKHKNNQALFRM